jgi:uncharacterized protein YbjT (DUF2867 family)
MRLRVLAAGATGYLGRHVVRELKQRGMWVRALTRHTHQRSDLASCADEIVVAHVTRPTTLRHVADDVDVVFSSIGITRQRERFTYEAVDYKGNANLLAEAERSSVPRFVYVSIFDGPHLRELAMVEAKERFVAALAASPVAHSIIRPTGFFSDAAAFLSMARKGLVVLAGDGTARINPISGRDLAAVCVDAIVDGTPEIDVGGPEAFSYNAIAALAFEVVRKRPRLWHLADRYADGLAGVARRLAPLSISGPLEFLLTVTRRDMLAPRCGHDRLRDFFDGR